MKVRAMIAVLAAVCVCGSFVGCGNSAPKNEQELESMLGNMSEDEIEQRIENAAESIDAADAQATTEEETAPEIVYEPSDEILNADFSSGLIQIGNDVFRNGGYYTVNQFISEYEDRYDMSGINPSGLVNAKSDGSAEIVSLLDSSLIIHVYYSNGNKEEKIKVGEAIVTYVSAKSKETDCWYPKGLTKDGSGYDYDNIPPFLENNGFTLTTNVSTVGIGVPNCYGAYWEYSSSWGDTNSSNFIFNDVNTEKNLFDCYPLYKYKFIYRLEDGKACSFDCLCYPTYVSDLSEYPHI